MKQFLNLEPTVNQTFRLIGYGKRGNLSARLEESYRAESNGDFERACCIRYEAFQDILSSLPDDENSTVELDRNHANTLAAMETILASAIDNYLACDYELSAAQAELLIDLDSEDPFEATPLLSLCYVALGEWECLEDIITDLGDKSAICPLVLLIADFANNRPFDAQNIKALLRFKEFVAELLLTEHATDREYLQSINSNTPSKQAKARELYLRCEPVLNLYPGLLTALKNAVRGN